MPMKNTAIATEPRLVGIYLRISKDRENDELGVRRQERECRELVKRNGWTLVEVYIDNGLSAYSRKRRPAFQRLKADTERGRINTWVSKRSDRLSRDDMRDLEDLIDFLEDGNTLVATVSSGVYDLTTADGRLNARLVGVVARHASEMTAERIGDKHDEIRDGGWWRGGQAPYGYRTVRCGHFSTLEVIEPEKERLQWMAEAVLAGRSLQSVARQLNAEGVAPPEAEGDRVAATTWGRSSIRKMLVNPTVAGLIKHTKGKGEKNAEPMVILGPAQWPAILDPTTWEAVQVTLMDPARRVASEPREFLLSGMAYVGDRKLQPTRRSSRHTQRRIYTTWQAGTKIDADRLEGFVIEAVMRRADAGDTTAEADRGEVEARREVARIEALMASEKVASLRGEITPTEYAAGRAELLRQLAEAKAKVPTQRSIEASTRLLLSQPGALRKAWPTMEFDERRRVLKQTIQHVEVAAAPRGTRVDDFDPERVTIHWLAS